MSARNRYKRLRREARAKEARQDPDAFRKSLASAVEPWMNHAQALAVAAAADMLACEASVPAQDFDALAERIRAAQRAYDPSTQRIVLVDENGDEVAPSKDG